VIDTSIYEGCWAEGWAGDCLCYQKLLPFMPSGTASSRVNIGPFELKSIPSFYQSVWTRGMVNGAPTST
jgi:hypothetical protein